MDTSKLIDELVRDECRGGKPELKPYPDSKGKITIGVGRNLTDCGISREEAYRLCNNDIENVTADLDQFLPWWRKLDEVRQRVLANMAFNMGVDPSRKPPGKLLTFKHTLSMIEAGQYESAATSMLQSLWAKQVGTRAERLAAMMRTGQC